MDSIERMRRLNELTKELKQRGFAESSFEAIQQANQIYGDDEITSEVKHGIINNAQHEKLGKENGENNMEEATIINMEKKVNKLSENVDTLTNKLNEIIKAINDMDSRITMIKNKPERIVEKIVEKPVYKETEQRHEETQSSSQQKPEESHLESEKPKDEYSMNQRTGAYKPTDVAIDKMFYYGNKKKSV